MVSCPNCYHPVDDEQLKSVGIVECIACGDTLALDEEALTFVDAFDEEEYLGG